MADLPISLLPSLSLSAVALSDLLVIVNGGTTKNVALSTIFASSSASYVPYVTTTTGPTVSLVSSNSPFWNTAYTTITSVSADWIAHLKAPENIFVGPSPFLQSLTTGHRNIAIGIGCLSATSTGSGNVALGYQALGTNVSGSGNTAIGYNAGYFNLSGTNNTYIGNQCVANDSCESNTVTLGNGAIKTLRCQAQTITSLSDARDKTEIAPLAAGLELINSLKPVSFLWNTRDQTKTNVFDTGFIAQDLQKALKTCNVNVPGLVSEANPDKLEASYSKLIPALVKAIQELSAEVDTLKSLARLHGLLKS